MNKKQLFGIIFDIMFVIAIIFTAIFIPLYYRSGGPIIEKKMVVIVENIECIDRLPGGSYKLKISLMKGKPYTKIPIEINGADLWNHTIDFNISKTIPHYISSQDLVIYFKLQRGIKSEIKMITPNENGLFLEFYDLWFYKFGGIIRIRFECMIVW